jgi:hypothetical protein
VFFKVLGVFAAGDRLFEFQEVILDVRMLVGMA